MIVLHRQRKSSDHLINETTSYFTHTVILCDKKIVIRKNRHFVEKKKQPKKKRFKKSWQNSVQHNKIWNKKNENRDPENKKRLLRN